MLAPKQNISFDYNSGDSVRVDDITGFYTVENPGGYGTPNISINDVNQVRFLFSSFLTVQQAAQDVTECLTNVEYEIYGSGSNTVQVDTKTFVLGDKFILMSDQTPTIGTGLKLRETGRYAAVVPFLPPDYFTLFAPSAMGINNLIYPDSSYFSTYEVYDTEYDQGGNALPLGTYIVKGNPGGIIELDNSIQYRVGEVFTTTQNLTSFNDLVGTNFCCTYNSSETATFSLCYHVFSIKDQVQQKYAMDGCPCKEELQFALFEIQSRIDAIFYNFQIPINNDYSGTQALLDEAYHIGVRALRL